MIAIWLEDLDNNFCYYVLLRATDLFLEDHRRYPGSHVDDIEMDIGLLKKFVSKVLGSWQITNSSSVSDDKIHEL